MCTCVCAGMYNICVYVCSFLWRPEIDGRAFSSVTSPQFLRQDFTGSLNLNGWLGGWSGNLKDPPVYAFLVLCKRHMPLHLILGFSIIYFLFYTYMCVSVFIYAPVCKCLRRPIMSCPLELEIEESLSSLLWVLVI